MNRGIPPGVPPFGGPEPYFGYDGPGHMFPGPPPMDPWGPPLPMPDGMQRQILLDQVMSMTDDDLFRLPPEKRAQIIQLRMQFARGY